MSFIYCYDIIDWSSLFDLPTLSDSGTNNVKHFQPALILTKQYLMSISEIFKNETLSLNICDKY
jgi:hypothetical protein